MTDLQLPWNICQLFYFYEKGDISVMEVVGNRTEVKEIIRVQRSISESFIINAMSRTFDYGYTLYTYGNFWQSWRTLWIFTYLWPLFKFSPYIARKQYFEPKSKFLKFLQQANTFHDISYSLPSIWNIFPKIEVFNFKAKRYNIFENRQWN